MASFHLAFDAAKNTTPHVVPKCYDVKLADNHTNTVTLANYNAKDGGIPINFGLNCLGWMVSERNIYATI